MSGMCGNEGIVERKLTLLLQCQVRFLSHNQVAKGKNNKYNQYMIIKTIKQKGKLLVRTMLQVDDIIRKQI